MRMDLLTMMSLRILVCARACDIFRVFPISMCCRLSMHITKLVKMRIFTPTCWFRLNYTTSK